MLQRNLSINYLEQALNFNRYNLHALGKKLSADIERAKKILDEAEKPLSIEYKELCYRVGLYYALYKRSKPEAKPYLEYYLQLADENTYEKAEAYGLLAYIEIIQGGYHESHENTPLNMALNILKNLDQGNLDNIKLRIFLEKYVPLMRYRDSYLNLPADDKRPFIQQDMDAAIDDIKQVITEAEKYSASNIDIDRAEVIHLYAAMLIKQGFLAEAKTILEMALRIEKEFSRRIAVKLNSGKTVSEQAIIFHWMTYTTGQTLADLYRREKNYDDAITTLHEVLTGQSEFFTPLLNHPDIAKTLDFLANSYRDKGDFQQAFAYYLQTLDMKEKVLDKYSVLIQVTLESLMKLMNQYPQLVSELSDQLLQALQFINHQFFEWNDYKTIAFSKKMLDDIEKILLQLPLDIFDENVLSNELSAKIARELAILHFRTGAFYAHIKRAPDAGLERLLSLQQSPVFQLLKKHEQEWIKLHIAYLYQQKLVIAVNACRTTQDKKESEETEIYKSSALALCNEIVNESQMDDSLEQKKLSAFSHCLLGLVTYESVILSKEILLNGIKYYFHALQIYCDIGATQDGDQYPRALNRAKMMVIDLIRFMTKEAMELHHHSDVGDLKQQIELLTNEVKTDYFHLEQNYWMKTDTPEIFYNSVNFTLWIEKNDSPYPARFLKSFAEYFELVNDHANAKLRYQAAHRILYKIEGKDSLFARDMQSKFLEMERITHNYSEMWKIIITGFILYDKHDFSSFALTSKFFLSLCAKVFNDSTIESYAICLEDPVCHEQGIPVKPKTFVYDNLQFFLYSDKIQAEKKQNNDEKLLREESMMSGASNDHTLGITSYPFLFQVKSPVKPVQTGASMADGKALYFQSATTRRSETGIFCDTDAINESKEYTFNFRKK